MPVLLAASKEGQQGYISHLSSFRGTACQAVVVHSYNQNKVLPCGKWAS